MSTVEKFKSEEEKDFFDEMENKGSKNETNESKEEEYVPEHTKKENKNIVKPITVEIKPQLNFLTDPESSNKVYIGRKKSVLKQYGDTSCAYLGKVFEDDCQGKEIYLDGLNPHVVFLDGSRGSGKSYGIGVIAEDLAKNNPFIGQIVVDPVGVFWSMRFPNQEKRELEILKSWNLEPKGLDNIKVFVPEGMAKQISKDTYDETFSIYPSLLSAEDWCLTFGIDRFNPTGLLLEKTLTYVKEGYVAGDPKSDEELKEIIPKGNQFTLDDIVYCLHNNTVFKDSKKGYKPDSIRALVSRFEAAKAWGIFSDHGTPLTKLSREKQLTILDTSFLDDNITALVIGVLARRILAARKLATRQDAAKKFETKDENPDMLLETEIPPTWLYIDEAHTLIPSGNTQTPATIAIIEYVKQGRRPGCSMVFATQQPSAINSKVLSQVDIFISHKLVFNDDINAVQKRMPAIIPDQYKKPNFIKTLPVGVALIGDRREETSRAFIIKIKPRCSQHEGRDAETVREVTKMNEDQIITYAVDLLLKKIKNTKQIKESYAKDILDVINIKYHNDVSWKKVLKALREQGVLLKNNLLILNENSTLENKVETKVEKEIEVDEEDEYLDVEEDNQDAVVDSEIDEDSEEEYEEDDEDIDTEKEEDVEIADVDPKVYNTLPIRITREVADNIAKTTIPKRFILFKGNETINNSVIKYRSIYKISYNLYGAEEHFVRKECYVDSVTGEFIHFLGNKFKESTGLPKVPELSEADLELLYILKSNQTIYSLVEDFNLDKDTIEKQITNFKENNYVVVKLKGDVEVFRLNTDCFDVPFNAAHKVISSLNEIPLKKKDLGLNDINKSNFTPNQIHQNLIKLWGHIEFISLEEIYWPVWKITLVNFNFKQRIVSVDAVLGQIIDA